jgi:uncharacterized membrane protein
MSAMSSSVNDERTAPIYRSAITTMTWGFRIAAAILMVGLAVALAKQEELEHQVDPFADILPAILDGKAAGIIDLAIVAIMLTPLITVVTVLVGFRRIGDRRYTLCSFLVLCILGVSVLLSLLR